MTNFTKMESERFRSKYKINALDCWVWQGPLDRDGYGTFYFRRKNRRAHRVAWYAWFDEIDDGYVINHKCEERACVNPQHLEAITIRENALNDSRSVAALNARKTTCKRGHEFDSTYVNKTTGKVQRVCTICEREKHKRLRKKWAAEDTLRV